MDHEDRGPIVFVRTTIRLQVEQESAGFVLGRLDKGESM